MPLARLSCFWKKSLIRFEASHAKDLPRAFFGTGTAPIFNRLFMLLPLSRMDVRYARHFMNG